MKTKNTKELRLRANAHCDRDHVEQGTYGSIKRNGRFLYQGCAVGCLSVPHRKRDLEKYLREVAATEEEKGGSIRSYWWAFAEGDDEIARLQTEFGLQRPLLTVAEACFEGQGKHGAAIEFIRDFAHAVPEDVDIRPRDVMAFLRSQGYYELASTFDYGDLMMGRDPRVVAPFTKAFLDWLRNGARLKKAVAA